MSIQTIPLSSFLEKIREIAAENPKYRSGGSGKDGTCDCIGLIIGAIRRAGGNWPGIHGSNYSARYETRNLEKITNQNALRVGELVYKHRSPGEAGYDLPARCRTHPDRNDYYHVGVGNSVSPLRILHMTTPSIQTDTKLGKWSHHGWCSRVTDRPEGADTIVNIQEILAAAAEIEKQLDRIYDAVGGKG